jgi:hypothetical protein
MKLAVRGANDKRGEEDQSASPDRAKKTDELKTAEKDCLLSLKDRTDMSQFNQLLISGRECSRHCRFNLSHLRGRQPKRRSRGAPSQEAPTRTL